MAASSPLLQPQEHGGAAGAGSGKLEIKAETKGGGAWWRRAVAVLIDEEEATTQLCFAFPMILTNVSYYAITLVSVMFAGHLGDLHLAGATLANSWGTVTGFALMVGLSGALETLCGQAYGARVYKMLGIYLQSSIIISIFFSILVSVSWYFSEPILIWLHQEPQVANMAALYLQCLIPGLYAYALLQCTLRFLQTQTVVIPLVVCSVVPLLIHVGLAYVTVHVFGLGFKGAALSASVSIWISFIMLAIYVKYSDKFRYTWKGFTAEALHHVIPCMKLAVPSAVMVCLEYWAFEILVLLAGLLPNSELNTSLIAMCVNTEAIAYMVTYGFSATVSTRVSNEIGAGNLEKAKNAVSVTLKLAVFLGVTIVLLLAFGHDLWAKLFSESDDIIRAFASMTPLLTVSIVLDSAQGVLSGVSRGCGWQHLAAWTNLVAFYVIGMTLALLFSFKLGFQAKGLWTGLICGLFCQSCTLLLLTLRTNWTRMQISDSHGRSDAPV
ncbi:protein DETOXIFICATION 18-like [Zingiber officinale]|uniref:protein DETOXIFICATION 18-like n=1 Tax=Zingiber officinale TaxID=94328 RepID=UPI001C4B98E7|nr:protein DETOXIFICATION 18-like [Zingiber officinale]